VRRGAPSRGDKGMANLEFGIDQRPRPEWPAARVEPELTCKRLMKPALATRLQKPKLKLYRKLYRKTLP
jgi:hypothetical protein